MTSADIEYGNWFNCTLTPESVAAIPFLLMARLYGQDRVRQELHIVVNHPASSGWNPKWIESTYHKVLSVSFPEGTQWPFPTAILHLEGKLKNSDRMYAELVYELRRPGENARIALFKEPPSDDKPQD